MTLLVMAQHGIIRDVHSPIDISYLADTVVLMRYFEAFGEIHTALSVLKKRTGGHERTVRELRMGPEGICIGRELRELQGILGGHLNFTGSNEHLEREGDERGHG